MSPPVEKRKLCALEPTLTPRHATEKDRSAKDENLHHPTLSLPLEKAGYSFPYHRSTNGTVGRKSWNSPDARHPNPVQDEARQALAPVRSGIEG